MAPRAIPIRDRLLGSYREDKVTGCWVWTKGKNIYGYGMLKEAITRKQRSAHRVSYEVFVGPIPDGMSILHSCDNPACINPDHLRPGTQSDNIKEASQKGRLPTTFKPGDAHPRYPKWRNIG